MPGTPCAASSSSRLRRARQLEAILAGSRTTEPLTQIRRALARWSSRREDAELADELSAHLELAESEHVSRGLGPDAPAVRALKSADQLKQR